MSEKLVDQRLTSPLTGRYVDKISYTRKDGTNYEIAKYYAKDGTQIKGDYYMAAEAKDLANNNGFNDYYDTKVIQKDGKFYLKVTAKTEQPAGMLAEDYLKKENINDGTLKKYNSKFFEGYDSVSSDGKQQSDLNKPMKPGESLLIPVEAIEISDSPVGWFRRNIMTPTY